MGQDIKEGGGRKRSGHCPPISNHIGGGQELIVSGPFTPDVIKPTIIAYSNYCIRQGGDN